MMIKSKLTIKDHLRIISTITVKDIADGFRSKLVIANLIIGLLLVYVYRLEPALSADDQMTVFLYDPGQSVLTESLENSAIVNLYTMTSEERVFDALREGDLPELGLVVPPGFNEFLGKSDDLNITGYMMHWVKDDDARVLVADAEAEISYLLDTHVQISLHDKRIYPDTDSGGVAFLASTSVIVLLTLIGLMTPPAFILEERKNRTMDVLMISPASGFHIAVGKLVSGLFYVFLGAIVALGLNYSLVTNWWVALAIIFVYGFCIVNGGLLLGSLVRTAEQLPLVTWIIFLPLLLPIFLSMMRGLIPEQVINILKWFPSVSMGRALKISFSDKIPLEHILPQVISVIALSILFLLLTSLVIRNQEE